jgi:hypothetical protein
LNVILLHSTSGNLTVKKFWPVTAGDFDVMADDIESKVLKYRSRLQSSTDEEKVVL